MLWSEPRRTDRSLLPLASLWSALIQGNSQNYEWGMRVRMCRHVKVDTPRYPASSCACKNDQGLLSSKNRQDWWGGKKKQHGAWHPVWPTSILPCRSEQGYPEAPTETEPVTIPVEYKASTGATHLQGHNRKWVRGIIMMRRKIKCPSLYKMLTHR